MRSPKDRFFVIVVLAPVFFFASLVTSGCGAKEGDEPTKYKSQAGLEELTRKAQMSNEAADNPKFSSAKNTTPNTPTSKDIDSVVRPDLVKLFSGAKLVSATGPEAPKADGEVVEDRLIYSVKKTLTDKSGDELHAALIAAGFSTSPRLGRKPSHGRKNVVMSLFGRTSLRGYSFVINVDMANQKVIVESYKLGSKYDRLM